MTREPPNTAQEPTAAPLLPPSLRSYGGTGRASVAAVRTRAVSTLSTLRRATEDGRSAVPVGGRGSAWVP
jgi:hypothetical protein